MCKILWLIDNGKSRRINVKLGLTNVVKQFTNLTIQRAFGPETFRGLPGAILGLATEDGGVVYFAKKVEILKPDFEKVTPKVGKKVYTDKELRTKLEADFGKEPWGKGLVAELFMW